MKHITKLTLSVLFVIILIVGCDTDDLHELNINPLSVNKIDENYFFTTAELSLASSGTGGGNRYIDWNTNIGMCAQAIQHLANAGIGEHTDGDKYIEPDLKASSGPFNYWLSDAGRNIYEVLKQTGPGGFDEGNKVNMRNATRILHAFNFSRLSDMYGSVPFSEANMGVEGIFFPKYDKQKDIYAACLIELDEATAALSSSNMDEGFAYADIIYQGDIAKWKRWGYSIMLRLAMRVSNVDAEMASKYVTKAIAGGVFTSNKDNVLVPMTVGPSEGLNQNGISRAMYPGDGNQGNQSFMSKTLINWLMGTDKTNLADDDPRLMILSGGIVEWTANSWVPYPGGTYPLNQVGLPNGVDQAMLDAAAGNPVDKDMTFSKMNWLLLQDDDPYMLMNYGEVELLMAEALARSIGSGIPGSAKSHYDAGVKASMQMYIPFDASFTVSDEVVNLYLSTYPYAGPKPALEMIGEQLWVNHFMNWYEAWSDWRRTGYPQLTPVNYPGNITNGQIPTRLRYPPTEVSGNPNYETGATKPDFIYGKVWWDGGGD